MKIHSAELRHVRQIKELTLDLSAPLTVVGGPNGVGKTTVQQAVLGALFFPDKATRDSFVSRFDPDSPPTVALGLSHGGPVATIQLNRNLTDDKGQWSDGTTVLKAKGQALKKVQEILPINADAAALLLWGRQDDMTKVVHAFPSDGHSLLTAATVRGAGPDPKEIIKRLQKETEDATKGEKGGKIVGALTRPKQEVARLDKELSDARA